MIGIGLRMIVPDFLSLGDYRDLASRMKIETTQGDFSPPEPADGAKPAVGDNGAENGSTEGDGGSFSIDWGALSEEVVDSVAWVSVDGTDIDFPVVQGDDNEWYLYHDAFGRESYANVFLDYRAQPDGQNAIVYAHTHWANTGFHQIAETDEQWRFDEIGKVYYSTPTAGTLEFTPVAALHVYPDFYDVQEFSFEPDEADVRLRIEEELAHHELYGEWNLALLANQVPDAPVENCALISTKSGDEADLSFWWVMSEGDIEQIRREAALSSYHAWLSDLVAKSTARRSDYEAMVASSERSLVLACCSWPYDDQRVLLVCVR